MVKQTNQPPYLLKLLAHDLRWGLLQALASSDYRVQELALAVDEPMNLVSYHLKLLRQAGLLTTRRSESDGRDIYYQLDIERLREMYQASGSALHPGIVTPQGIQPIASTAQPVEVLFVCTHNSARSQMAEALFRHKAPKQFAIYSAGSQPTGLHPDAIETMAGFEIDISGQQSKDVARFEGHPFDYVITVCDRAREVCPVFTAKSIYLHWGFGDPVCIENTQERRQEFIRIASQLARRIDYFLLDVTAH